MKKKMAFLGVLLMAVIVTGYSVSGTYAKYVSSIDIADEARVAKWDIAMGETSMNNLDLFKNSYDYDATTGMVVASSMHNDEKNIVAPGTKGQYTFSLSGNIETAFTLEVDATIADAIVLKAGNYHKNGVAYTADETVDNDDLVVVDADYAPIQYSIDGKTWTNAKGLQDALNALYTDGAGTQNVYGPQSFTGKGETTIYWKWAFDETDTTVAAGFVPNNLYDTLLGNIGTDEVEVSINITATQSNQPVTVATLD